MMLKSRLGKVSDGLMELVLLTREYADTLPSKITYMQELYLDRNTYQYSTEEAENTRYYLKAALYKFYLATLALEQIWALSHSKRNELITVLEHELDSLDCSNDELLLISYSFENFLFQGRAFLDFYMLYLCTFLKTGFRGSMNTKRFYKELRKLDDDKASKVLSYFEDHVFSAVESDHFVADNWGTVLTSLRNKVTHRDRIIQKFAGTETLAGSVLFNWPTIKNITYERFCQDMQNGMFYMIYELSQILYELEWIPGAIFEGALAGSHYESD